jgi:hypothetical protein
MHQLYQGLERARNRAVGLNKSHRVSQRFLEGEEPPEQVLQGQEHRGGSACCRSKDSWKGNKTTRRLYLNKSPTDGKPRLRELELKASRIIREDGFILFLIREQRLGNDSPIFVDTRLEMASGCSPATIGIVLGLPF